MPSPAGGVLQIRAREGDTVAVGAHRRRDRPRGPGVGPFGRPAPQAAGTGERASCCGADRGRFAGIGGRRRGPGRPPPGRRKRRRPGPGHPDRPGRAGDEGRRGQPPGPRLAAGRTGTGCPRFQR
ncbi:MAG: hypothetical protein U0800_16140 [Isosphaeraceae bacterium]